VFEADFWLPESVNALAAGSDDLFVFILWVTVVSLVLVMGAMLWFVFRYRSGKAANRLNPPTHHLGLEVTWTVIPTIILFIVFFWGTRDYVRMSVPPASALEIRVTGQKWFWTFDYPEAGVRVQATQALDEQRALEGSPVGLVVPVGVPVKLVGSSVDVIHSMFIPAFRVKKDVLPNRYTTATFLATEEGEFDLFCAEYCGTKHSGMITKVTVVSEEDFEVFIDELKEVSEGPVDGATVFAQGGCAGCHGVTRDAPPGVGPSLHGLYGREERLTTGEFVLVDENYLRESIVNPMAKIVEGYGPVMPAYVGRLSEEEMTALMLYLKGLGAEDGAAL